MKLAEYFQRTTDTPDALMKRVGCSRSTITKAKLPGRYGPPSPEVMAKIAKETGGLVTPNDFITAWEEARNGEES